MNTEQKAKAYDEALKQVKKELAACGSMNCDAARLIFRLFPQLCESCEEFLTYLEKQKEQIPYIDFVIKPHKGDDNNPYDMSVSKALEYAIDRGFGIPFNDGEVFVDERYMTQTIGNILRWADEHQKEQKPVQSEDEREYVRIIKSIVSDFIRDKKPEDVAYYQKIYDWLDGRHVEMKEQKPTSTKDVPYITDEHFYEREPADSFKYKLAEYMTKCCTKKEGPYGYTYGISAEAILKMAEEELLKRGVVQKPAEWSEEDENMMNRLIGVLDGTNKEDYHEGWEEIFLPWLKSFRPQPKQEWSEEDKKIYQTVFNHFNSYITFTCSNGVKKEHILSWLKSLRPQPHKEIYQAAKHDLAIKFMHYLDKNRPEGKMCLSNGECEDIDKAFKEGDWAKIIRYIKKYQSHWKPSKEQMEALNYAIAEWDGGKKLEGLYALRTDLKKLT